MVVKHRRAPVETTSVPRVLKPEPLEIEMMAELVAEGAEKCSKGRDLFSHRRAHPHPNEHRLGIVIPEQLCGPAFPNSQGTCCEHANAALRCFVELCGLIEKICAGAADSHSCPVRHRHFDGPGGRKQAPVLRQIERPDPITFQKISMIRLAWWSVSEHHFQRSGPIMARL